MCKGGVNMSHKLSTEEFKKKLFDKRGNDVTLLSDFSGSTNPITVRFNTCGHEVIINRPYNVLNGSGCSICKDKNKRRSPADFARQFNSVKGDEYTLLSDYVNSRTKVTVRHNVCKNIYSALPKTALKYNCPFCSKNAPKGTQKFTNELNSKYPGQYLVKGNYVNAATPILVKHLKCGRSWSPTPDNILSGRSHCPYCSRESLAQQKRLKTPEIQKRINDLFNNSLVLSDVNSYINGESYLNYTCLICGHHSRAMAKNLLQGHGCPYCANEHRYDNRRPSFEQIATRAKDITNGEYILLSGDYKNNTSQLVFKHLECGTTFTSTWLKFSQLATRCPNCRGSFGEQIIKGYLKKHKIDYQYAYIIDDLIDKRKLHFDFYFPQYRVAIEYDGVQHFDKSSNLYNEDVIRHDRMKDKYCLDNNILLIRVPYYEDINSYLDNTLLDLVSIKENKYSIKFKEVPTKELYDLMLNYHYLHRKVNAKYAYGLYLNNKLKGMLTYTPVNKTTINRIFTDEATVENSLELSRLYIKDEVSQTIPNITSQFVSWTLKQLKKQGNWFIISFADSGMNHAGSIYQACNFLYLGVNKSKGMYAWGGPNKYRERWKAGNYYKYLILPSDKHLYVFGAGNKKFKKSFSSMIKLAVHDHYPKNNKVHYLVGDKENRLIKDRETGKIYQEDELVSLLGKHKL